MGQGPVRSSRSVLAVVRRRGLVRQVERAAAAQGCSVVHVADALSAVAAVGALAPSALVVEAPPHGLSLRALCAAVAVDSPASDVIVVGDGPGTDLPDDGWPAARVVAASGVGPQLRTTIARRRAPRATLRDERPPGEVTLDRRTRVAVHRGVTVRLSRTLFRLLEVLDARRGDVCSRRYLLDAVWGIGFDPGTNVVDATVWRLRRSLPDLPIACIHGEGYRLDG